MRLLRRFVPALFSFSCYGAIAKPLSTLVGLKSGASDFWAFVLVLGVVMLAMLKLKGKMIAALETLGGRLPKWLGAVAGLFRSLGTSALVLFPLAMAPWAHVQDAVGDYSLFAAFLQKLFG